MKAVTLTASSYNELKSLFLIRNLYIPTDVKITPTQYSEICKRFVKGYEKLHDNEEITKAMKEVNEYTAELEKLGVRDRIVRSSDFNYSYIVKRSLSAFFLCLLFLILSLPSLIMLSPFAYIIKNKAESERIAAKKKNPNKIEAKDVVSSVKIQYSILLMPFMFLLWNVIFYFGFNFFINGNFITLSALPIIGIGSVVFPFYLYFAAIMLDFIFFSFNSMMLRLVFFFNPSRSRHLKDKRKALAENIKKIVDKHIEEADPKYKMERILFNQEAEENMQEEQIFIRRNSNRRIKTNLNKDLEDAIALTERKVYN